MLDFREVDIAVGIVEVRKAVFAAGVLRAIEAASAHQRGQSSDGDTVKLMVHNMVYAALQVGNGIGQSFNQSFGNLS